MGPFDIDDRCQRDSKSACKVSTEDGVRPLRIDGYRTGNMSISLNTLLSFGQSCTYYVMTVNPAVALLPRNVAIVF